MKTLLRIDASAQRTLSHSRRLANRFESNWRKRNPNGKVIVRDLARDPLPHLDEESIAVFYAGGDTRKMPKPSGITLSDQLIAELKNANDLVISSAVYNFGMPSSLKAWIDHIVRFGYTLTYGENGPIGLLSDKRICLITARGGCKETSPDYQMPSIKAVFAYLGVQNIECFALEGTRIDDGRLDERISKTYTAIDNYFEYHNSVHLSQHGAERI